MRMSGSRRAVCSGQARSAATSRLFVVRRWPCSRSWLRCAACLRNGQATLSEILLPSSAAVDLRAHLQRRCGASHGLAIGDLRHRRHVGDCRSTSARWGLRAASPLSAFDTIPLRAIVVCFIGWALFVGAVVVCAVCLSSRGRPSSRFSCPPVCPAEYAIGQWRCSSRCCSGPSSPRALSCAGWSRRCAPDCGRSRHCVEAVIVGGQRPGWEAAPDKLGRGRCDRT